MNLSRWVSPFCQRSKIFFNLILLNQWHKTKNYLLANINMVRKPIKVSHFPTIIVIDPGNICNLSCALCITGQKKSLRPAKFLPLPDFKKIIAELGKTAIQLDLYNWGEPFLNKDIFKMIVLAKKYGLRVETSSNLLLLTPKSAEKLVRSGLDRLIVSLHGATKKTTQIYMKSSNFDKVIKHLKLLISAKKKLKSSTPFIVWRYVVSRYNEKELEKAKKMSKNLGVDYFETLPLQLAPGFDPEQIKKMTTKNRHWLPSHKFRSKATDCFWPWEIISINPDGTVQPCCVYSNPKFDFGNILKTPFEKIWNGEKYQRARTILKKRIKTDEVTICGLCLKANFLAK